MTRKLLCGLLASACAIGTAVPVAIAGNGNDARRCALRSPEDCADTNQLLRDPAFTQAVAGALEGRTERPFNTRERTSAQVLSGLGGPPEPIHGLAGGSYLFAGCRLHSCAEKAAVVIAPSRRIVAIAVIYYPPEHGRKPSRMIYQINDVCGAATGALERWSDQVLGRLQRKATFAKSSLLRIGPAPALSPCGTVAR